MRHQHVSDIKINVEAELARVAVGEAGGCTPHTPEAAAAQRQRAGADGAARGSIAAYLGGGDVFDRASQFAVAYADQTDSDHQRILEAMRVR